LLRSALKEITGFSRTAGTVAVAVPDAAFAQAFDEANVLNQQVIRLNDQGRYSEAISLEQRVLAIQEKTLGPENPNVATSLNTQLYTSQGQYANAEPLYKRSLVIKEKVLGPDHPDVAVSLNGLAELYRMQGAANVRLLNVILFT
jgi:tetratricopeptide (TPR) repeat protein